MCAGRDADKHHAAGIDDLCLLSIYDCVPSSVVRDRELDETVTGIITVADKSVRGPAEIFHSAAGITGDTVRSDFLKLVVGQINLLSRTAL